MPNLTSIGVTSGIPTSGTGTVSTIDALLAVLPPASVTPVVSSAAESGHVLKGSAGALYSIDCTLGAVSGYLMVFNATSAPADGAVTPIKCWPVASDGTSGSFQRTFTPPIACSVGITVVFSTTGPFTKTASATAMFSGEVA